MQSWLLHCHFGPENRTQTKHTGRAEGPLLSRLRHLRIMHFRLTMKALNAQGTQAKQG